MIVEIFASTDVGRNYDHNEDNFAICRDLSLKEWVFKSNENTQISEKGAVLLIADGMGGTNAGEVASNLAQQSVRQQFDKLDTIPTADKDILEGLKRVIFQAHEEIVAYQGSHLETAGMGTTLTILWVFPHKSYVAWCGDSRLYIYRENTELTPFTNDHSVVWDLVKGGNLTPEEARIHPESNIITQSLGMPSSPPKPDTKVFETEPGDRLLLCSDGLNSMLSDSEIKSILAEEKGTMHACKRLVEEANQAGGRDNITVILLDVKEKAPLVKPVTLSQKFRKKNRIKNVIIGVMAVLLITLVAYSAYKPREEKARDERKTENNQISFEFALHTDKDTTISATQLTKDKIDSIQISKAPNLGKVSKKNSLSFVYHPIIDTQSSTDTLDVFLYGSDKKLSEAHILFKIQGKSSLPVSSNSVSGKDSAIGSNEKEKNTPSTPLLQANIPIVAAIKDTVTKTTQNLKQAKGKKAGQKDNKAQREDVDANPMETQDTIKIIAPQEESILEENDTIRNKNDDDKNIN